MTASTRRRELGYPASAFVAHVHALEFRDSIKRVRNLIAIYRNKLASGRGRRSVHATDVLRAATVLMHATLEDLMRAIASYKIGKDSPSAVLDKIPLIGLGHGVEAKKFWLSALAQHADKSVDDVIRISVQAYYYNFVTFNDSGDIVRVLEACNLDVEEVRKYLPTLDEMIRRRHRIVHHGDKDPRHRMVRRIGDRDNRGYHLATPLSAVKVEQWLTTTERFARKSLDMMSGGQYSKYFGVESRQDSDK